MKKKMKWSLIVGLICVFMLCGCSGKEKEASKETVESFLAKYQEQDGTCGEHLAENDADALVEFEGFQSVLANSLEFKITSVKIEEEFNIVNTIITNVDFGTVMDELVKNDLGMESQEDILNELQKRLSSEDAPKCEFEVAVMVTKENKIQMTSDLSNALLGGYTQYIYELTTGGINEENN